MNLVRFLTLRRNSESVASKASEALWAVQKERKADVTVFIMNLEKDEDPEGTLHTDRTGLKMKCYISGNTEEQFTFNYLTFQSAYSEIQDYIGTVLGQRDDFSEACKIAAEACKCNIRLI